MEGTRGHAQKERADARSRRRSTGAEPSDTRKDGPTGGGSRDSEAAAALKRAAGTALAAAAAGAVGGAVKALLDRRGQASRHGQAEDSKADQVDESAPGAAEASPAEAEGESQHEGEPARFGVEAGASAAEESGDGNDDEDGDGRDVSADESNVGGADEQPEQRHEPMPREGASSADLERIVNRARGHVEQLLGNEPESVSGLTQSNGSWSVTVDVVEVHRIPDSTDILGSYEVVVDDDGDLLRLARRARYRRTQVEEGT